jgi:hypothetical protein
VRELIEPWEAVAEERARLLETELERSLGPEHVLAGKTVSAIAANGDDVLFEVVGSGYAVVHLTWTGRRETTATWPMTRFFATFEDWSAHAAGE